MPYERHEPPASALARGSTKSTDIESARRHLEKAQRSAARELQAEATRYEREAEGDERDEPVQEGRA
jgi:hypothetical protein